MDKEGIWLPQKISMLVKIPGDEAAAFNRGSLLTPGHKLS